MPKLSLISARQTTILTTLFTVGSAILIIPSGMASSAKQDAWIAALAGIAGGLLLVALYNALSRWYPQSTLIGMMEQVLGKWLGRAVSLAFVMTWVVITPGATLYYLGNFLATQILPETPMIAVNVLFILIVVMGVRAGIETIARTAELLFPWCMLLYIALVVLVMTQIEPSKASPVMESGPWPIGSAALGFVCTVFIPQLSLLLFLPPAMNRSREGRKGMLFGSLTGGMMIAVIVTLSILVLGPEITARSIYPSYSLAKKINIGNFLQRIEAFMAILWFITLYFRETLYLYGVTSALAEILRLKDGRPLVLPLGMITVVLSIVNYPNVPFQQTWDTKTWIPYAITVGFLLPILLAVVHLIRKAKGRKTI
ncbi:GerAB/ArcD/ProY family transporter [Paenibacillus phocaensis]|uniref:GerAB/ArcD/ProY family transporter n=1 Tax=Paenibacillus phocaensis TaxID=1776378 RepID=UPI000839BC58|nr:endospore germination permease [Paenibacillus phocaensis]